MNKMVHGTSNIHTVRTPRYFRTDWQVVKESWFMTTAQFFDMSLPHLRLSF